MTCGKNETHTGAHDERLFKRRVFDGYRLSPAPFKEVFETKNSDVGNTVHKTLQMSFRGLIFAHKAPVQENVLRSSCFISQRT